MLKPLFKKAPYWYQQGKELLQQDYKDPARLGTNIDGVANTSEGGLLVLAAGAMVSSVAAGETQDIVISGRVHKLAFVARPGSGGTVTVSFTGDTPAAVLAGTATWSAWAEGAVSAQETVVYDRQFTAIRVAAATADGSVVISVVD